MRCSCLCCWQCVPMLLAIWMLNLLMPYMIYYSIYASVPLPFVHPSVSCSWIGCGWLDMLFNTLRLQELALVCILQIRQCHIFAANVCNRDSLNAGNCTHEWRSAPFKQQVFVFRNHCQHKILWTFDKGALTQQIVWITDDSFSDMFHPLNKHRDLWQPMMWTSISWVRVSGFIDLSKFGLCRVNLFETCFAWNDASLLWTSTKGPSSILYAMVSSAKTNEVTRWNRLFVHMLNLQIRWYEKGFFLSWKLVSDTFWIHLQQSLW